MEPVTCLMVADDNEVGDEGLEGSDVDMTDELLADMST